jgi:hypothetical protein
MSRRLKELSHNLRQTGHLVTFDNTGTQRTILVEKLAKVPEISSEPSNRQGSNDNEELSLTVSSASTDDMPVPAANTVSNIVSPNRLKSQDIDDIDDADGFSGTPRVGNKAQLDLTF